MKNPSDNILFPEQGLNSGSPEYKAAAHTTTLWGPGQRRISTCQ